MATTLYLSPIGLLIQQLSNLGAPLAGGLVNIYVAGSVNTPQATFTDSTGTSQNANPLVLNSAGRLAASNAPVSVWVPSNTPHKMVLTDGAGNLLAGGACMDNLYGINDPIGVLGALSSPASGSGADLIANAVRSYDVYASVRAAIVPTLGAGQTLVLDVEGSSLVNDGGGGLFLWSATSVLPDDNQNTLKPNAIVAPNPGRYLRQNNLFGTQGTFPLTVQGCTTAPVITASFIRNGNIIVVDVPPTGVLVSNSTSFGLGGWPAGIRDNLVGKTSGLIGAQDNSATGAEAFVTIASAIGSGSAAININSASGVWTGSGNKALNAFSFTYIASNGTPT